MHRVKTILIFTVLAVLSSQTQAIAQSVNSVEEDWELQLNTPNDGKSSPQLTFMMSPLADCQSYCSTFELNKQPATGTAGGLQVQMWNMATSKTEPRAIGYFPSNNSLYVPDEKIQWTQRMSLSPQGVLTLEVVSGTSTTWGKFGGGGNLIASMNTTLKNLNAYDPDVSAANSGPDFGHGRIAKLILRKARTYENNKKNVEQALDRVVFPK